VLDPALFMLAVQGFAQGKGEGLPLEDLLAAPCYVSFMLGVRFLTDHLSGDVYFKVSNPGENLLRARQQFAIVAALEQQLHPLNRLCAELSNLDEVIA
jgi:hypothetical protein